MKPTQEQVIALALESGASVGKWGDAVFSANNLIKFAAAIAYAAGQASKVPEGWKLVPVEPTPEMLKASLHESKCRAWQIYKWMISASPSQEGGES